MAVNGDAAVIVTSTMLLLLLMMMAIVMTMAVDYDDNEDGIIRPTTK